MIQWVPLTPTALSTPSGAEQQQQEEAEPNISPTQVETATEDQPVRFTQRGAKRHEYTQFILDRWDEGERIRIR